MNDYCINYFTMGYLALSDVILIRKIILNSQSILLNHEHYNVSVSGHKYIAKFDVECKIDLYDKLKVNIYNTYVGNYAVPKEKYTCVLDVLYKFAMALTSADVIISSENYITIDKVILGHRFYVGHHDPCNFIDPSDKIKDINDTINEMIIEINI